MSVAVCPQVIKMSSTTTTDNKLWTIAVDSAEINEIKRRMGNRDSVMFPFRHAVRLSKIYKKEIDGKTELCVDEDGITKIIVDGNNLVPEVMSGDSLSLKGAVLGHLLKKGLTFDQCCDVLRRMGFD